MGKLTGAIAAAVLVAAGPVRATIIGSSTTLTEAQTNTYASDNVAVDGSGVVLTLSNSATYGVLPVYRFGNLIVTNGATVVCLSQGAMSPYTVTNKGVAIQSAGDIVVAGGCSINADGKGFAAGQGPGKGGASYTGGSHGGIGDNNVLPTYGSCTNPTSLGSGGRDKAGGGAIELAAVGNVVVNGTLSANGAAAGGYGGGAGGSLWIAGGTLSGTGEVQVSGMGGAGPGYGGGGGGRLSIDDTVTYNFRGNIRGANGSNNSGHGGAGTIYFPAAARQDFTVYSNQTIVVGNGIESVFSNLTIYGTLIPSGTYAGQGTGVVFRATNLTVAAGGGINADGWGWRAGAGPAFMSKKGSSHGGRGSANNTNALYGSVTQPTSMGTGDQGAGGGAFKLIVASNLIVNGSLSANGANNYYGDGAGGSIWITGGGTLGGTGTVYAYGGGYGYAANGAGGGGRISIDDAMTYAFTGNIKVGNVYNGYPGTLYLPATARNSFLIETNQTFVIGNGTSYAFGDLTVKGTLDCGGDPLGNGGQGTGIVITANNLTVAAGGKLTANSRGFYGGYGPGVGANNVGATHGGVGYNNPSNTYGLATQPTTFGSGRVGMDNYSDRLYWGGGAIRLVVTNTLTVNGAISANGGYNGTSGSAGGSIWVNCGYLVGTGLVTASADAGANGGGGGRIAIQYSTATFTGLPASGLYTNVPAVSSSVTVNGGYTASPNGLQNGSIYVERIRQSGTVLVVQ